MPGTYSQIMLHIVFSTKGREPQISRTIAERLYPYIGGIVRECGGCAYAIGGVEDHLHMLIRCRPAMAVSDLVRTIKSRSSKWLRDEFPELESFAWQEGYSAFSVSKSKEKAVTRYIRSQEEHHKRTDFRSELIRLLDAHGIEYEPKYLCD
ncbi:MAG: IS200/IS605 family transposase [Phycisphaerales bacterium]|nr:IS200/IS605 family transposase [Phycisphaerales bacterium]